MLGQRSRRPWRLWRLSTDCASDARQFVSPLCRITELAIRLALASQRRASQTLVNITQISVINPYPDAPLHAIGRRSRVHGHARRHRELGCDAEAVARSGWSSESSCDFLFLFSPPISVFDGRRYGIRVAPTLGLVFGDALRRDAPCDRTRHRTPSVTRCPPRSACFISFGSTLVDWRRRTARPIRPLSRTTDC